MSRRQAATGLAAGLALIVAAPIVWWATQPAPAGQTVSHGQRRGRGRIGLTHGPDAGNCRSSHRRHRRLPVTAPATQLRRTSAPSAAGADQSAAPSRPSHRAEPAPHQYQHQPPAPARTQPPPAPPARIELPSLGVDTDVVPVGVDDNGLMDIPQDVSTVGWYRFGPAPGAAAGSAVLSGHVDDYRQGVGVFGRIGDLGPGDTVRIVDDAGVTRDFSVLSREEWSKGEVPLDRLFDRGGSSRLVLITCGGSFNSSTLGYDDNIAITAVPVGQ